MLGRIGCSIGYVIACDADDAKAEVAKLVAEFAERVGEMHHEWAVITQEYHQQTIWATERS